LSTSLEFSPSKERLFLLTLAGIQFTHIVDFMIMMPLGPQLIRLLHIDTHEFGLLLSAYTFTAAVSGVLATTYIDRFDRRKLLLTLYALFAVATLCCGLAPNYAALLVARAMAGAFGGVLGALVQTMIADAIPFERRGRAMGTVMAAFALATVAGVPLGLVLANAFPVLAWRAPFFFVVLLATLIFFIGYRMLPAMTAHLNRPRPGHILAQVFAVARHPQHLKAFAFVSLMMMTSFTVIPYLALYTTSNLGFPESFITYIYLCGGVAILFASRLIGRMADKYGKQRAYKWMALAAFVPLLISTHLTPVPGWVVLLNSILFFILVPGRVIPGMSMVTAVAAPPVRGAFMSLVSSVQMLSSGLATLLAGLIITRDASGAMLHFNLVGYLAVALGLLSIWMVHTLKAAPAAASEPP
jgi:predicted MFS family arabinose efflux permease